MQGLHNGRLLCLGEMGAGLDWGSGATEESKQKKVEKEKRGKRRRKKGGRKKKKEGEKKKEGGVCMLSGAKKSD